MKVNDMNNLFVGFNEDANFRILICADDEEEAQRIADEYCEDADMSGYFEILEFSNLDTRFDCDYVVT